MAQEAEEHIGDYQNLLREFEVKNGVSIDLYDNNDNLLYSNPINETQLKLILKYLNLNFLIPFLKATYTRKMKNLKIRDGNKKEVNQ